MTNTPSVFLPFMFFILAACSEPVSLNVEKGVALDVYKTPACGCCTDWAAHLKDQGFTVFISNHDSLAHIKKTFDIAAGLQSCHTGVSKDGFFFEGHIPARYIHAFLAHPPADALGLAVPGMPTGSPGMEMGDRFSPYDIIVVKSDGGNEVFARISSAEEQF